ncbi:MAG: pyrroloquinoline quinone-dependent dehydrogenase [Gammaproteobacteria bacterium]
MASATALVSPRSVSRRSAVLLLGFAVVTPAVHAGDDWTSYGGDAGGSHYSSLDQINRNNVGRLVKAWEYHTGELARHPDRKAFASFHATPLLVPAAAGHSLVFCTPFNRVIALDPATGRERWVFDPQLDLGPVGTRYNCRGLAYWEDRQAPGATACAHRLYMGTGDLRLVAVDARTGRACPGFGAGGAVDVKALVLAEAEHRARRLGRPVDFRHGDVQFSSPPVVAGTVVVVGSANNTKFRRNDGPSGAVRAFDLRTGDLRWSFDPVPRNPGDPEAAGWSGDALAATGAANVWSIMTYDAARDLVFLPTASAAPDFFGGTRPGDNRYANSVVALRAATGEVAWHYQLVHHDVWDLDLPAQPMLLDLALGGQRVPSVVQLTKMGLVFAFDRSTGAPVLPIEERPVPGGGVPGERLSPTQPFPATIPPLVPGGLNPEDAWGYTFIDRAVCRRLIEGARHGQYYLPPGLQGTVNFPGMAVTNWGGGSFDPARQLLIVPVNRAPTFTQLIPVAQVDPTALANPMAGLMGNPGKLDGTPYAQVFKPLLSPLFSPCNPPPWGELVALDLATGKTRWRVPLGVLDKLVRLPLPLRWGTPTSGGPIVTAGGVVFIGATMDERFRAFDVETGEQLWETETPTAAMATPMTYQVGGRQFVAVAAGGHMWQYAFKIGDSLIAWRLP